MVVSYIQHSEGHFFTQCSFRNYVDELREKCGSPHFHRAGWLSKRNTQAPRLKSPRAKEAIRRGGRQEARGFCLFLPRVTFLAVGDFHARSRIFLLLLSLTKMKY